MKKRIVLVGVTALFLSFGGARAQDSTDGDEAEATIRLMGAAEVELPDAVTKEISLPASVTEDAAAVERAAQGQEKANKNRENREQGPSRADAAREHGAEMAEQAREDRENRGRSEDRPEPPKPPKK